MGARWSITPGNGFVITAGSLTDSSGFSVIFNTPGTYNVRLIVENNVTNNPGNFDPDCNADTIIKIITILPAPNPPVINGDTICSGETLIFINNTPGNLQYQWSGPDNFTSTDPAPEIPNAPSSASGAYYLTVTDGMGCTNTADANGIVHALPVVGATGGAINCGGGTLMLQGSSNVPNSAFTWTGPGSFASAVQNPVVNMVGAYLMTATAPDGCTGTAVATVSAGSNAPTPVITGPAIICSNNTTLSAPGNYTAWQWSAGQSGTDSITVSAQGTYTVTVTDASGCTGTDTQAVSGTGASPAPVITGPTSICSGSIVLTAAGNFSNWQWSNGQSGIQNNITVTGPGDYAVLVTASNGCTGADTVTVSSQGPPSAAATPTQAGCGLSNGSINLTVNGGTPGYTFLWSNSATAEDPQNLSAGTYTVTVTDAANCSATASATVGSPNAPSAVATATQAGCGLSNGSINLTVQGGTPNYTYEWSNSSTGKDLSSLVADVYTVTVTDAAGCTVTTSATVTNIDGPVVTAIPVPATCGLPNGRIEITVLGGTAPYGYLWSTGATNKDLTGVPASAYTVTVTDATGCTAVASAAVTGPLPLAAADIVETCLPSKTAYTVSLTLTGGTPPYALASGNGSIGGNQFNSQPVPSGTPYNFSFTDTKGCGPLPVSGSRDCSCVDTVAIDTLICAGDIFQFKNLQYDQAGEYSDTISTPTGCDTLLLLRLQTTQPEVDIVGDDFLCKGEGTLLVLQSQNCQGCTFSWNNPAISGPWGEVTPAVTTTYIVTVTDNMNCTAIDSLTVVVQDSVTTLLDVSICFGVEYEVCGKKFDKDGTYKVECFTAAGCDSTIILSLHLVSDLRVEAYPDTFYLRSSQDEGVFDVAFNDSLVANSGWTLEIPEDEDGKHGRATPEPDGRVRYRLDNGGFYGVDSFLYRICSKACPDTCDVSVAIVVVQNKIPNAFSPDGDGYNDTFDPFGWHLENDRPNPVPTSAVLNVWNRWGEVVFHADPYPENGWDGRSFGGKIAPQGTYYYTLQMPGGETELIRGAVHVLVSGK